MENPSGPLIVAAGEALIDLVEQRGGGYVPHAGGAVYNLARALSLQGMGTAYLNALSGDQFGRLLGRGLREAGVILAQPEPVHAPTSLALVALDSAGKAEYTFYRDGVADRVGDAQALIEATRSQAHLRAVCTGCLALMPEDRERYLPWLQDCRRRGLIVAVDANLRPAVTRAWESYRAGVRAALALADVIKVSDDDLALLAPDTPDPEEAAVRLFDLGPARLVALTRGAAGATLMTRDGRCLRARDAAGLEVADTVGAGDCFFAGLLASLITANPGARPLALEGAALDRALHRAVVSAGICVERHGCVPPNSAEVEARLMRRTVVLE